MLLRSQDLFPILFNDVFNNVNNNNWNRNSARDPQINITESAKEYRLEICVPGLSKEDLSLTIDTDSNLVIAMEHKVEHKSEKEAEATAAANDTNTTVTAAKKDKEEVTFLRHDFTYPHFKETMALPDNIHRDKINAKVENGILRIFLPKVTAEEQAKLAQTITIE